MDLPVTNIAIVCDKDKVPRGYTAITLCPCGHDAQLWEKVMGGEDGERYLCYTKEEQKDGLVLEDMFIPGPSQQYLKKGYKIMKDTVEGEEPMYHKQLAYKRVPKSEAKKVIVDIIVCRSKDNISKLYTKLAKVNSLRIAFRTADYKPPDAGGGGSGVEGVASKMGRLSVGGEEENRSNLDKSSPPSSSPPPNSASDLINLSSPPPVPPQSDTVQVKTTPLLASAPPPQPSVGSHVEPDAAGYPDMSHGNQQNLVSSNPYPAVAQTTSSVTTPTPYPAPASTAPYPRAPPSSVVFGSATPYQSNPSSSGLPYAMNPMVATPYGGGAGYQSASYSTAGYGATPPVSGGGGYPPPPGTNMVGYDTNIGFSFGGTGGGGGGAAPAPYNPYHHQQPPPGSGSSYPPAAPPPQGNWGGPPPPQGRNNTYGFNF